MKHLNNLIVLSMTLLFLNMSCYGMWPEADSSITKDDKIKGLAAKCCVAIDACNVEAVRHFLKKEKLNPNVKK